MTFKTFLLTIAIFSSILATAQDKIYKTNGTIIDAKVKEVNQTTVNYKRFDNPNGPDYSILKREVDKIVYQNGTIDKFEAGNSSGSSHKSKSSGKTKHEANRFGDNILTVIPAAFTADIFNNSINDPGIGICYERMLDEHGHISICIPIILNFTQNKDFNSGYFYNYNGYYSGSGSYTSYSFMPGIKFYPADSKERFRYSIGASFFALFGSEPYGLYDNSGNATGPVSGDWHYTMYGLMITNSLNVSVSKHFYMEFDLNGGIPFSDNRVASQDVLTNLATPLLQFSLKAGYRF